MSAKKGTDYVFKIVAIVAVVLVIVAIGGFVAYYTNGFTNDFTTFYAVCDGNKILSSASGYRASRGEPLKVDVVYMFEDLSAEQNGYTVKVVPNVDANTDFEHKDLTSCTKKNRLRLRRRDSSRTFWRQFIRHIPSMSIKSWSRLTVTCFASS